jgi:hypothetical protein
VNAIAMFGVPVLLPPGSRLELDQICDTEAGFDFCIIEVSSDKGASWTEVARNDMNGDPAWANGVADPTQYRHASIDLSPFAYKFILVRFRLQSDALLSFDGWYVDNVHINDASCTPVVGVTPETPRRLSFAHTSANPARGAMRFEFQIPQHQSRVDVVVYDVAGRELRRDHMGALAPGDYHWVWNRRGDDGRAVNAGIYFARLEVDHQSLTRKAVLLAN